MILLFMSVNPLLIRAQDGYVVNYQMCLDSALKKNASLEMKKILSDYQKELTQTGWNINKTSLQMQYGQYNSIYNDNGFTIQQNLNFPGVYQQQKKILQKDWQLAELETELEKKNLRSQLENCFTILLY